MTTNWQEILEALSFEDILESLDNEYKGMPSEFLVVRPLGYLNAILRKGLECQKELKGVRVVGMPKFVRGDQVMDGMTKKTFFVSEAQVSETGDVDKPYSWFYKYGVYFIPEGDLELIVPCMKR